MKYKVENKDLARIIEDTERNPDVLVSGSEDGKGYRSNMPYHKTGYGKCGPVIDFEKLREEEAANEKRLDAKEADRAQRQHYDLYENPLTTGGGVPEYWNKSQPKDKVRPYKKVKEFEVIHLIIALVTVAIIWFGISAYQTDKRCQQSGDYVACLTQDVSQ